MTKTWLKALIFMFVLLFGNRSTQANTTKKTTPLKTTNNSTTPSKKTTTVAIQKQVSKSSFRLPPKKDVSHPQKKLTSFFALAKKNNLDLKILKERIVQAELLRAKAWSAFQPKATLQGIYRYNNPEAKIDPSASIRGLVDSFPDFLKNQIQDGFGNSEPIVITPANQFIFIGQIQWGLSLATIPLLRASYITVKQIKQSGKQLKREVLYGVAKAYYGVLLAEGLVDIARQSWKNAHDHLQIAKARHQAGVVPILNVTRAQFDVIKAQRSAIQAENTLANVKSSLALLTNQKQLLFRPIRPASPTLPPGTKDSWLLIAKRKRPELKAALLAMKAAKKHVTSAWLQWAPTLGLQGTFQWQNAAGFGGQNATWNISVVANFALYDSGKRITAIKEANSKLRQAKLEHKKQARQIENEFGNAFRDYENAKNTVQVSQKQLELAKTTYTLTQARYKSGVATPVEVSDALTLLTSARVGVLREKLNADLTILNLKRIMHNFP